jgi:hypothetical protein
VQTVEKFLVIYDYSSPGHSNKEEVDKAWHAVSKEVNVHGKCTDSFYFNELITELTIIHKYLYNKISSLLDDVTSSTREDVIERRHVLLLVCGLET